MADWQGRELRRIDVTLRRQQGILAADLHMVKLRQKLTAQRCERLFGVWDTFCVHVSTEQLTLSL